jgi:hypothetical protein
MASVHGAREVAPTHELHHFGTRLGKIYERPHHLFVQIRAGGIGGQLKTDSSATFRNAPVRGWTRATGSPKWSGQPEEGRHPLPLGLPYPGMRARSTKRARSRGW